MAFVERTSQRYLYAQVPPTSEQKSTAPVNGASQPQTLPLTEQQTVRSDPTEPVSGQNQANTSQTTRPEPRALAGYEKTVIENGPYPGGKKKAEFKQLVETWGLTYANLIARGVFTVEPPSAGANGASSKGTLKFNKDSDDVVARWWKGLRPTPQIPLTPTQTTANERTAANAPRTPGGSETTTTSEAAAPNTVSESSKVDGTQKIAASLDRLNQLRGELLSAVRNVEAQGDAPSEAALRSASDLEARIRSEMDVLLSLRPQHDRDKMAQLANESLDPLRQQLLAVKEKDGDYAAVLKPRLKADALAQALVPLTADNLLNDASSWLAVLSILEGAPKLIVNPPRQESKP